MSDPNQPMHDPYQQQPPAGSDPYYGGYPPTPLGYDTPATAPRRPVSPIVLGIIGIIYAIHHTACMGFGMAVQLIGGDQFVDWVAGFGTLSEEQIAQMKSQMAMTPWMLIQSILWVVLGFICWFGAIGSFLRWERARAALLLYAAGFLILGAVAQGIEAAQGFPSLKTQADAQAASGGVAMPLGALVAITLTCAAVFAVYPICVLFFYTRPRVIAWFTGQSPPTTQEPMYYGQ